MGNVNLLTFAEGGGILQDAIVVFKNPRFILGDYGGKAQVAVPMLRLPMIETGEDGDELEHVQFFSVGGAKDFIPDDTGLGLTKIGSKDSIVKNSNYAILMQSIMDAGFPPEMTKDNDISFLDGLKCHVTRKAMKREGMQKEDNTVLIVDKIYIDEKTTSKGTKKTAGASGNGKAGKGEDSGVDEATEESKALLIQIIFSDEVQAAGGTIPRNQLVQMVLPFIKENKNRAAIIKTIVSDAFLNLQDGWKFENGVISVG